MDQHPADRTRVFQADQLPAVAAIRGAEKPGPSVGHAAAPRVHLAGAGVDHVRLARVDGQGADGEGRHVIEEGSPAQPAVGGAQHTALGRPGVDHVVVERVDGDVGDPAADVLGPTGRPDHTIGGLLDAHRPRLLLGDPPLIEGNLAMGIGSLGKEPVIGGLSITLSPVGLG